VVDGFIRKEERNDAGRVVGWCGGERESEEVSKQQIAKTVLHATLEGQA